MKRAPSARTGDKQETIVRWDGTKETAHLYTNNPSEATRWQRLGYDVRPFGVASWIADVPKQAVALLSMGELP